MVDPVIFLNLGVFLTSVLSLLVHAIVQSIRTLYARLISYPVGLFVHSPLMISVKTDTYRRIGFLRF